MRVFCFNSDGTLNRVQMPAENATYSYSDYEKFGDKLFPRKMRLTDHGRLVVDAIVDDLAWENEPYPSLFTPPSGAVENPGCAHPSPGKATKTTQPDYPLQARQQQRGGAVTLATRIQPDGSVQVLTVTETAGRDLDEAAARAVRQWKFSPYMCGDTPVPVETDITVAFRIQR